MVTGVNSFRKNNDGKLSTSSPDAMVRTGNVAANWKVFKEAYDDFATATELTAKDDEIQAAILKTVMGNECQ